MGLNRLGIKQIRVQGGGCIMKEFIEGRARLVRMLAHKADPFTKDRLLKLAKRYDEQLGLGSKCADDVYEDQGHQT